MNKGISLILTLGACASLFLAGCIGSTVDKPAKGSGPQKSPQVSATPEAKNPKILAALDNDIQLRRHLKQHPEGALRVEIQVQEDLRDLIAIAVRPDSPQLLTWINTYLTVKAPDLTRDDLLEKLDR